MKRRKKSVPSGQAKVRDMKARPCFCGGGAMIRTLPFAVGKPKLIHVECGSCYRHLMYGEDSIEFLSERDAVKAWNLAISAEPISG